MSSAMYILRPQAADDIYGPVQREQIASLVDVLGEPVAGQQALQEPGRLAQMEVLLSGWGGPVLDEAFLAACPKLKVVLYGAGSIRGIVTDAFWDRGIPISSAWAANAVPVAEYTLSQILWCLKGGWHYVLPGVRQRRLMPRRGDLPGAFGSTVGIIALGMIGQRVCRMLQQFDVRVLAYDPLAAPAIATELGAELVSLEELFARSDVVSLHAPSLPQTRGMITGEHLRSMKPNAAFINTARGAVVRQQEMIDALAARSDLVAVLDVLDGQPPAEMLALDNVVLTPHVAGSLGAECRRMGQYVVDELRRFLAGQQLKWAVDRRRAETMA